MVITLVAGFAAFGLVRALGSVIIIFGRRRTVFMILAGYLMGMLARYFLEGYGSMDAIEHKVVGYIIPGLIAVWLDRRGIVESFCSLLTASVVVRLILILIFGSRFGV
jgi:poly-gamma-glutamate biosynthesis protein PgsC/CapC